MKPQKPNILFIVADQMAGPALPVEGRTAVKAPHLMGLAEHGVLFDSAYCNSPLCAPSRASMLTGQLPSRIGAFDNAAEFPASIPTMAHYLRALGYRTCLSGKMHFIGPDQLHGFEERLTTDIYPALLCWTPDWERPDQRFSWYHNMSSVVQAGQCVTTNQLDFDEEVTFQAVRKLFDIARDGDERPFFLTVSFTHPHDPYAISQEYWDRYDHADVEPPAAPALPAAQLDPHSRRIRDMCAMDECELTEAQVQAARRAYYGAISYVDDKVGLLLRTLEAARLRENTIVIFVSDHGDMLGERGLWYKMNFFEWSARVPMIFYAPDRFVSGRVSEHVSLVDLLPTLVELASQGQLPDFAGAVDGRSLAPVLYGEKRADDTVLGEYLAEGALAPCLMIRRGSYKYIYSEPDPDQLYDLSADPHELDNLAGRPEYEETRQAFRAEVNRRWQPQLLRQEVIASQRRRRLVAEALTTGRFTPWDFQPYQDASRLYIRHHMDLDDLERRARFPGPES